MMTDSDHVTYVKQVSLQMGGHGEFGHLNVLKRDHDSICTHHGKHDRVTSCLPSYDDEYKLVTVSARIDGVWKLGTPTIEQVVDVMRKENGLKGSFTLIGKDHGQSTFSGDNIFLTFYHGDIVEQPNLKEVTL